MKNPDNPIAVIDVGSNSIKLLIAAEEEPIRTLDTDIREVRISRGMQGDPPALHPDSMAAAVGGIRELIAVAGKFTERPPLLVTTSAVRDAVNGPEFCRQVSAETGHTLRVLTGDEEARYVAKGARCDPALTDISAFRLVDLGGGSLELISFSGGEVQTTASLPLGAVRLTERFIADPAGPVSGESLAAIREHTLKKLELEGISLAEPPLDLVGSGGAFMIARRMIQPLEPDLAVESLRQCLNHCAGLSLAERRQLPGLPPARADIMPAALQVMVTLAHAAGRESYRTTGYNLRYGIVSEQLEATKDS